MIPDPTTGRVLRAIAIGLVALCAVVHVAWTPERAAEPRMIGLETRLEILPGSGRPAP